MEISLYKDECTRELAEILDWWIHYMTDNVNGGFYGRIDHHNNADASAPKGIVLNSRILWTFSAAYVQTKKEKYLLTAIRAFNYIRDYFTDPVYGGVYWLVNCHGKITDSKKQIYGQAFCIYGLAEYCKVTQDEDALEMAKQLFYHIEQYSVDKLYGGYLEAFNREWALADDLRLSEKDENEVKSMNTHLHVLEAYTNLCQVWKNDSLLHSIDKLLNVFRERIIDKDTCHLHLFFAENWDIKSSAISFGHDVEAGWLLQEAAEIGGTTEQIRIFKELAVRMTDAAAEGIDKDGGMWHEHNPSRNHWIREKHWWPQAEAMVGFINAWQITGREAFFIRSLKSWEFIKKHLRDEEYGEWHWGIYDNYLPMQKEDKAGIWKCPYHNGRALLEIIKRLT